MEVLTNVGTTYDTIAAAKGMGWGLIDFTGVTQIRMSLFVNKVGSGTQSWQLWNHTDGSEIGVIADSGAAGDKTLDQTFSVSLTGEKIVRIRCKSTVAADDPVFYCGAILTK